MRAPGVRQQNYRMGSSARPFWMLHLPGIASMLASLVALRVEWGFWTNQVAAVAETSIRVLLAQAITADVQLVPTSPREVELFDQRFQEARLLVQTDTFSECIWAFDQAYCRDDPEGQVYPNTGGLSRSTTLQQLPQSVAVRRRISSLSLQRGRRAAVSLLPVGSNVRLLMSVPCVMILKMA